MIKETTCKEKAYLFIQWVIKVHPEICNEYFSSEVYKKVNETVYTTSLNEAIFELNNL